jgi:nucleoid-associated protein Lsr2
MSQRTIVQLYDDLDGTTSESVETICFSLDAVNYEIDLNIANASALRDGLAEYVSSARRTGGRLKRSAPSPGSGNNRAQSQVIREWAKQNDWEIADRGRIPVDIIEAYEQATASSAKLRQKSR